MSTGSLHVASGRPAHDDPPRRAGQRQGLRLLDDGVSLRAREATPGLDIDLLVRASPRPGDLALDEECARPDAWGPEPATTRRVGDEELAVGSLEQVEGIAAGEEPSGCGRPGCRAKRRFVAGEDPRVADRRSHRSTRRAERVERVRALPGNRPREKTARSRAATTYALNRGPHNWTRDGSSHVVGSVPATREWIERSAARGMLSCRPAHAARRSELFPRGNRSSSAPTCRRNARICALVSFSGAAGMRLVPQLDQRQPGTGEYLVDLGAVGGPDRRAGHRVDA